MILMVERKPLYVRLPAAAAMSLDRAAFELQVSKQDLVADLVHRHLEGPDDGLTVGRASLPTPRPEVLTAGEAAQLLQSTEAAVTELAEAGELPGRKVGGEWRFARAAVLAWLAAA